jgi:hypothetical protein
MQAEVGAGTSWQPRQRLPIIAVGPDESPRTPGTPRSDISSANRPSEEFRLDVCRRIEEDRVGAGLDPELAPHGIGQEREIGDLLQRVSNPRVAQNPWTPCRQGALGKGGLFPIVQ